MKFILPLVIVLLGVAGGGAAGFFLSPSPEEHAEECVCEQAIDIGETVEGHEDEANQDFEYADISNQFVVPIIEEQSMTGMVVMSLSLEILPGNTEAVYAREPKLRDEFLRILFAYATIGGFGGNYLEANDLKLIRADLTKSAQDVLGDMVNQVLIVDMIRQDL